MNRNDKELITQEGDLVQLSASKIKYYIFYLKSGEIFQTHRGVIPHENLIGKPWGSRVSSHMGSDFYLLKPGLYELISSTKRNTQIMYPKDIGYILIRLNIIPGTRVIEAGTGSGGLTQVLASFVSEKGHVFSYDVRDEMQNLAKKNLAKVNLSHRVTFHNKNIAEGFEEEAVDSVFLDLPNPYDYLSQVKHVLIPGGFFGALLPTMNQINKLLISFSRFGFIFIDVCEILLRFYQAEPEKIRPVDRMVAHTGYLIFARTGLTQ